MFLDFVAGCLGGVAGVLVGHPLDTVKVHLQTDNPKNPQYRGIVHCMKTIIKKDNVRGLYRGITSPMAGVGLVNAIVFGVYGNIQRLTDDPTTLMSHFMAGSAAGFIQSIVCSPMELAKTRMQLSSQIDAGLNHKGPMDCFKHILRTDGLRGAYRGLGITAARDVPGFASYFVSYEYMMRMSQQPTAFHSLIAGGLAGIFSWFACYPMDVVKTCMQADGFGRNAKYKGVIDCAMKGYRSEGAHFFFRGLSSTLLRAFPMNAACFFVVSLVMRFADSKSVDVVVHSTESLAVVNLDSNLFSQMQVKDRTEEQLVRKSIVLNKNLHRLSPPNDHGPKLDSSELPNQLYPDSNKYYVYEDERPIHNTSSKNINVKSIQC